MKKIWAKFRLVFQRHWLWIAITLLVVVTVGLPLWYLAGMEESVRHYITAINVASLPLQIFSTLVFVGFLYLLQYGGGFIRFKKAKIDASSVQVHFSDVIGLSEPKREALEVVELIKDRSILKRVGGKILRGLLLMGPPGCGKTLLAKAIATEAGIPFLSVSGSEFVEIFVGVGAARVRKLFKQARQYAEAYGACIIFIDEIEVLGRTRVTYDAFGGGQEGNQTLNQLLVEMDGLTDSDAPVVVIGAMNMAEETLDPALLRPGRFDRKISVGMPNLQEREQIFAYYAKKIKVDAGMDMARLARKAVYKSPADIENILKEASLIAVRNKRESITYKDVSQAIERIELGAAQRLTMSQRQREMVAYHEAGHLIVMFLEHPTQDVFKASIIERGGTLGVVHPMLKEELHVQNRDALFASIKVSLASYVCEKIKYDTTTTGVSVDFTHAMELAHNMVWQLGMGFNGFVGNFTAIPQSQLSDALKERLNDETQAILKKAMEEAEATLKENWSIVERFVKELMLKEELDYDEIAAIFLEYGKRPKVIAQELPSVPPALPESAPAALVSQAPKKN